MDDTIYTIGHSTHSIERFLELLKAHSVTALGDVRSQPYSRMNPQFNREPLKEALQSAQIKYVFLGKELGARSEDKSCYRNGQVQYDLLSQTDLFKKGIHRVTDGARSYRIALMCAEKEPLECHRTILVARQLYEDGMCIKHILADGQVEEHACTIERLLAKLHIREHDFFRSNDEIMSEAYRRQGDEIAYREQEPGTPSADRISQHGASGAVE
jgi:uncharacterized protein (DUF488 family)